MMSDWAVMHTHMRCAPIVTVLIFGLTAAALEADVSSRAGQAPPLPAARMRWYKGNTHTHTLPGDGDSTPDEVVRWYREHRYNFLVLSDHNFATGVEGLNAIHGADERFLPIRGEEVSSRAGNTPIHRRVWNTEQLERFRQFAHA